MKIIALIMSALLMGCSGGSTESGGGGFQIKNSQMANEIKRAVDQINHAGLDYMFEGLMGISEHDLTITHNPRTLAVLSRQWIIFSNPFAYEWLRQKPDPYPWILAILCHELSHNVAGVLGAVHGSEFDKYNTECSKKVNVNKI